MHALNHIVRALTFHTTTRNYEDRQTGNPSKELQNPSLTDTANPILAAYLKRNPTAGQLVSRSKALGSVPPPERGKLAPSSIFEEGAPDSPELSRFNEDGTPRKSDRNYEAMSVKLDPQPSQRRRWERKMVIRRRGRLSKTELIKRTERTKLLRSEFWKTSMKKLAPLARQIAGKTIDEAIVQMDYSKKKAAVQVHDHLVAARNAAIVERGMGLGKAMGTMGSPATIRLKDGSLHKVVDRTEMYIDQAWVGKGTYGMDQSKRARGRIDRLMLPQTSMFGRDSHGCV